MRATAAVILVTGYLALAARFSFALETARAAAITALAAVFLCTLVTDLGK
jgi:hypothetical protein